MSLIYSRKKNSSILLESLKNIYNGLSVGGDNINTIGGDNINTTSEKFIDLIKYLITLYQQQIGRITNFIQNDCHKKNYKIVKISNDSLNSQFIENKIKNYICDTEFNYNKYIGYFNKINFN